MKQAVPSGYRNWQQHDRTWIVYQPYVGEARRLTKVYFSGVEEIGVADFEQEESRRAEHVKRAEDAREKQRQAREATGNPFAGGSWERFNRNHQHAEQQAREQTENLRRQREQREEQAARDRQNAHQSRSNGPYGSQGTQPPPAHFQALYVLPTAPKEVVFAAYKALALLTHPDRGGSTADMQTLNAAFTAIKKSKGWP